MNEFIIADGTQRVQSWSQTPGADQQPPQATVQCLYGPGLDTQLKGPISRYNRKLDRKRGTHILKDSTVVSF